MGWTLDEIKSKLKGMSPEKRIEYLKKEYSPKDLKDIFDELLKLLLSQQKKMSIYYNGYEEIKRGKEPKEIKAFLTTLGYSEAEEMPNPLREHAIKWFLEKFEEVFREIYDIVHNVLVSVVKVLGSEVQLESVSVTASFPPSVTFNFKLC
jgi:hypothetical protein